MAIETFSDYGTIEGSPKSRFSIPIRYIMAALGSMGLAIIYGFKVNASIAIVAMVNHTAINETNESPSNSTAEKLHDGPFVWDNRAQGFILSTYFGGYLVSMIPSGIIAEKVSAKWVMNIAVFANLVASLLSPIAANYHYIGFALMRFIQGLGGGASFPAMHCLLARWSPPEERNILASIVYAGTALGTVLAILLTGLIAADIGWEAVFYIEGGVCIVWCLAWIFIADSPEEQKRFITKKEKKYILNSLGKSNDSKHHHQNVPFPWKDLVTSKPFWAILISHFCSNCGWYMLLTQLPSYMSQILKFELKKNAGLSSLPFFCMWLFTMIFSNVLTIIQKKKYITMTMSRKIGTFFSSFVPMVCLMIVSYADKIEAVVLMTIAITFIGGMYSGFLANHIDIAPNFAGTLVAITNAVATIPGIVIPTLIGILIPSSSTDVEKIFTWRMIFFGISVFYVIEIIIYSLWGSAEEQHWNKVQTKNDDYENQQVPLDEKENN